MPKVSICIPAYNQIKYLQKTIDSVLVQTFTDYEIIITDDSNNSIVKDFVEAYKLPQVIHYYKNKKQLGTPENWNEAIRQASGEYIKILHHDDWLNGKNSLAKYVAMLDENPKVDFAFSATKAMSFDKDWKHGLYQAELKTIEDDHLILFSNNLVGAPSNVIYRREAGLLFDKNLKWLVDIEFYIRMLDNNKNFVYSPEMLSVTYLAEGRVSDGCANKETEVSEFLYVLNSLYEREQIYTKIVLKKCLLKTISILEKYGIGSKHDVRQCGYSGQIPDQLETYLSLKNKSSFLAKSYKKVLTAFE